MKSICFFQLATDFITKTGTSMDATTDNYKRVTSLLSTHFIL